LAPKNFLCFQNRNGKTKKVAGLIKIFVPVSRGCFFLHHRKWNTESHKKAIPGMYCPFIEKKRILEARISF
jgi:hypothetical protein